ncbi:hypothetical protein [Nocardia sp. NBC_01329]|uniref:hypothetical protein n=1 Tax=Nocardia sp. NBC_01329 TaxID=2903594 RepID=UPI002E11FB6D|nr:hypothetical protein OG405_10400 [Nocardia sp. NBC_01329]
MYPVASAGNTRPNADSALRVSAPDRSMNRCGEPSRQPKTVAGDLVIDRLLPQRH